MKLLTVISSTLLFVLISQQYTSALPVDETMIDVTTEIPHVEHVEKELIDLTTEMPSNQTKRESFATVGKSSSFQFQQQIQQTAVEPVQVPIVRTFVQPVQQQFQQQVQTVQVPIVRTFVQPVQQQFQQQVQQTGQQQFQQQFQETLAKRDLLDLTTEMPSIHTEREIDEPVETTTAEQFPEQVKKEFVDLTTEMPSTHAEREIDEPVEVTTAEQFPEQVKKEFVDVTTEMPSIHAERGDNPAQQQTQQRVKKEFVDVTTEMPSTDAEREIEEPVEESKTEQSPQSQEPHPEHTEQDAEEDTSDKKKRGQTEENVEEEKLKKTKEEKVEKPVEEEKIEKPVEEEKIEKPVEEEKTKEVEGEKTKPSDFCPENYVKFEDSCLFVGSKTKISARSGKTSTSKTDSSLVENFPVGDDNSCPPGTEHTERGVCQKILSEAEMKAKKIAHSCPQNAELVNGQCIFHSFDMMNSTMEMPLETSERPEIPHEESIATAAENKPKIESEFETTMQSVIKS